MSDDEGEKNKNLLDHIKDNTKESYKNEINLHYIKLGEKIDDEGREYSVEGNIPVAFLNIKPKISNREAKFGVGAGNEIISGGLFVSYDFKNKEPGIGAEVSLCDTASADFIAKYNAEEDEIKLNAGIDIFMNDPLLMGIPNCPVKSGKSIRYDFFNIEIKDVAHNTIGKALDTTANVAADFIGHVSPKIRAIVGISKELNEQAHNVRNIVGLNDIIRKVGDNELARNNVVATSKFITQH